MPRSSGRHITSLVNLPISKTTTSHHIPQEVSDKTIHHVPVAEWFVDICLVGSSTCTMFRLLQIADSVKLWALDSTDNSTGLSLSADMLGIDERVDVSGLTLWYAARCLADEIIPITSHKSFCELGSGTGFVSLRVACESRPSSVTITDGSEGVLALIKKNVEENHSARSCAVRCAKYWWGNEDDVQKLQQYDIIACAECSVTDGMASAVVRAAKRISHVGSLFVVAHTVRFAMSESGLDETDTAYDTLLRTAQECMYRIKSQRTIENDQVLAAGGPRLEIITFELTD